MFFMEDLARDRKSGGSNISSVSHSISTASTKYDSAPFSDAEPVRDMKPTVQLPPLESLSALSNDRPLPKPISSMNPNDEFRPDATLPVYPPSHMQRSSHTRRLSLETPLRSDRLGALPMMRVYSDHSSNDHDLGPPDHGLDTKLGKRKFNVYPSHMDSDRKDLWRLGKSSFKFARREPPFSSKVLSASSSLAWEASRSRMYPPYPNTRHSPSSWDDYREHYTYSLDRPSYAVKNSHTGAYYPSHCEGPWIPRPYERDMMKYYGRGDKYSAGRTEAGPRIVDKPVLSSHGLGKNQPPPERVLDGPQLNSSPDHEHLPLPGASKSTKPVRSGGRSKSGSNVCQSCFAISTPEWRKGPTGPRTLCNACGLLFAKMCRKHEQDTMSSLQTERDAAELRRLAVEDLSRPEKQMQVLELLRANSRAAALAKQQRSTSMTSG